MKISNKSTTEIQAAYQCENCKDEFHILGLADIAPTVCPNCLGTVFKKLWAQKIRTVVTITPQ